MSGKDTSDLIADIYADSEADLEELTRLRARIDEVRDQVLDQEGSEGIVAATSKSFDVTRMLVEEGILKTRHRGRDPVDHTRLMSIVEANVALLQATLNAFSGQTRR